MKRNAGVDYGVRLGLRPKKYDIAKILPSIRGFRAKCMWCCAGSAQEFAFVLRTRETFGKGRATHSLAKLGDVAPMSSNLKVRRILQLKTRSTSLFRLLC